MNMSKGIGDNFMLELGALCKPIHMQAREQGVMVEEEDFELEEKLSHSISMLRIHQLLPRGQARKVEEKLFKRIVKKIEELGRPVE